MTGIARRTFLGGFAAVVLTAGRKPKPPKPPRSMGVYPSVSLYPSSTLYPNR